MSIGRVQLTNADDIPSYRIAKGEIASDGDQDVDKPRDSYTCHYNAGRSKVRIVAYFVKDRKHLYDALASFHFQARIGATLTLHSDDMYTRIL